MLSLLLYIGLCAFFYWLAGYVGTPEPWLKIIKVVLVIVAVVAVLNAFGFHTGLPTLR